MYEFTPEQKAKAKHDPVMVDIETLGTRSTSQILSIGACKFDPDTGEITDTFHRVIDRTLDHPQEITVDQSTIDWWEKQSDAAKAASYHSPDGEPPEVVLKAFAAWVTPNSQIWGNGSDFDNVIMAHSYAVFGIPLPWKFFNNRCYRTMKNMFPKVGFTRHGTYHSAVDDAITQAKHLMSILKLMRAGQSAIG